MILLRQLVNLALTIALRTSEHTALKLWSYVIVDTCVSLAVSCYESHTPREVKVLYQYVLLCGEGSRYGPAVSVCHPSWERVVNLVYVLHGQPDHTSDADGDNGRAGGT